MLRPTSEAGPNGDGVSIGYDSASRPATTYTPNGAYVTYTYSTSPPQNTATMRTDDSNTTGRKTVTKFDGLGRAIEVDSIDASAQRNQSCNRNTPRADVLPWASSRKRHDPTNPAIRSTGPPTPTTASAAP